MDFFRKQVKADCEDLLTRFQQTQSVRFEVFTSVWREMKFAQIFCGTMNHKKRVFSRLVLDVAYDYFLPPFSFQIRVGGLYLLYSLYHCQTASPPEQIHLALKDWKEVKKFEKDAMDAQHLDAAYILQQLMFCKAFHFTAMPTLLYYKKKRIEEKSMLCEEFIERASRPQELINAELLEEMSNIHDLYEKMKTSVISQTTAQSDPSINLIRKELVSQLRSTVLEFYNWQQGTETANENENSQEGTSSQQEVAKRKPSSLCPQSSSRADLLASIKSKAYGEALETSKSRRHRPVEIGAMKEESGPVQITGQTRLIKPSLRSRTNETLNVSADVCNEATSPTVISRLATLESAPQKKHKKKRRLTWY